MGLVRLPLDDRGHSIQVLKFGDVQSVAFSTTATTVAGTANTNIVRLFATQMCHVVFGVSPTAATTDSPIAADTPEYIQIAAGVDIVSVIGTVASATARLWVTDCH